MRGRAQSHCGTTVADVLPMSRCTILVVLLGSVGLATAETSYEMEREESVAREVGIVGGSDVPPGKWPDTVAVLGTNGSCTGTLIAPDVVLTAGHCADIEPTTVVANTTDYSGSGGTRVGVVRTEAYPDWETTLDVAVVVLGQPITNVTPRRVGTSCTFQEFRSSTMVRIVGFGSTSMDGKAANSVLKEAMTQVTDPMCASSGVGCNMTVSPGGEFVAGGTGTADSCFGDSGGPVYLDTERGSVVVGAVSRGVNNSATPCGGGGIYVRTDVIVDWIEETTGKTIAKDACTAGLEGDDSETGDEEPAGEDAYGGDVIGGCSTTGGSGAGMLALAALAFVGRRRRATAKPAEDGACGAKPADDPPSWR